MVALTRKQRYLKEKHGTPDEFKFAVMLAVPSFISINEALSAIFKYKQEWQTAGEKEIESDGKETNKTKSSQRVD